MRWILWAILGVVVLAIIFLIYSDAQAKKFAEAERRRQVTGAPTVRRGASAQSWIDSLTVLIRGTKGVIEEIKERREEREQIRVSAGLTQEQALALL